MALSAKEQSKNINCLILVFWSTFETLHGCNDSPSWELRVASWGCQSYSKILIERIFLIWISENMHQVSTIKQLSEQLEQGRISLDALPMNEFQVAFHWPDLLEAFRNKTVERLETRSCGGEGKHSWAPFFEAWNWMERNGNQEFVEKVFFLKYLKQKNRHFKYINSFFFLGYVCSFCFCQVHEVL